VYLGSYPARLLQVRRSLAHFPSPTPLQPHSILLRIPQQAKLPLTLTLAAYSQQAFNMPGGYVPSADRSNAIARVEAPVTLRGYLLCVFAAFGG
jgi:hypothetical protein